MSKAILNRIPVLVVVGILLSGSAALADNYTFSLLSSNIQGPPGSTIGWGYSITNNSTSDWLVATDLNAGTIQFGVLDIIDYFDFPVIAPGATASQPFNAAAFTGLAALTWDASAPVGFINLGNFDLSAQWWTADPFSGGSLIANATDAFAPYSATVVPTPEPFSLMLLTTELVVIFVCTLRNMNMCPRRKSSQVVTDSEY